jgi:purine-binding chemotaxis protein CheW
MSGRKPVLEDQQAALGAYLDSLLREVDHAVENDEPAPVHVLHQPKVAEPVESVAPVEAETPPAEPSAAVAGEFQCLLFTVRGLTLAVPLEKLSGILEWDGVATKLPERPEWFLGVVNHRGRQAGIVDTAGVVMPERVSENERPDYRHIIFFDEGRWGFACEAVKEVIKLTNDEVRWRTSRTQRPWLAGTVIEHMCALLDVEAVAQMIQS